MKKYFPLIALFFVFVATNAKAQSDTITTDLAAKYIDKLVVVKGKIVNISHRLTANGENMLYLDLDNKFPNNTITIAIFKEALQKITLSEDELIDKIAYVSGTIILYKNKPDIAVHSIEQIKFK